MLQEQLEPASMQTAVEIQVIRTTTQSIRTFWTLCHMCEVHARMSNLQFGTCDVHASRLDKPYSGSKLTCAAAISLSAIENCDLVRPSPGVGDSDLVFSQICMQSCAISVLARGMHKQGKSCILWLYKQKPSASMGRKNVQRPVCGRCFECSRQQ